MQRKPLSFYLVFLLMLSSAAHAELPVEVRADLLKDQIVNAVRAKEFSIAQGKIRDYRALGLKMPAALVLLDAKVSAKGNDLVRANDLLEEYFTAYGKTDSGYNSALKLYQQVSGPAKQQRRDQAAAKARRAKEKAKADKLAAERAAKAKATADAKALRARDVGKCEKDDYNACMQAGIRAQFGKGGGALPELAAAYYKKACDAGHNDACNSHAVMLKSGYKNSTTGTTTRGAPSFYTDLFDTACNRTPTIEGSESKYACYNWANIIKKSPHDIYVVRYAYKRSCELKHKKSCAQFEISQALVAEQQKANLLKCEDDDAQACHDAAFVYRRGIIQPESQRDARRLSAKACNGGIAESCLTRGNYSLEQQSGEVTTAYVYFKRGCKLGHDKSCSAQKSVEISDQKWVSLLGSGCDAGELNDCSKLGMMYLDGEKIVENWEKGYRVSAQACELGDLYSCYSVGFGIKQGRHGADSLDPSLAPKYLKKACRAKNAGSFAASSCALLAELYRDGELVKQSNRKAKKYFKVACKADSWNACNELKKL